MVIKLLDVLEERNFSSDDILPVASQRSCGKKIRCCHQDKQIISPEDALLLKPEAALFSAGSEVSKTWAPRFADAGTYVIDNSSAWRMKNNVPLVVPEINAHTLVPESKIIANPNCSTIQLVMVLNPLHKKFGIKRVVVSTYQSVTGSGMKGKEQLMAEREARKPGNRAYPHPIDLNLIPHGGSFEENGYTTEEIKLVNESRKIMGYPDLKLTSTVVRVPVTGGHSESVNVEFNKPFDIKAVFNIMDNTPGIVLQDNPAENEYPMPLFAEDKNEVFVGRIRRGESVENGLNMWVVSDNLRKGAATNAVQILEEIIQKGFIC